MRTLTVTVETFNALLLGIIKSGVTFEATEEVKGMITINFKGGY